MIALIDGDIVSYRVGFTTEEKNESIVRSRVDEMLDNIFMETGCTEFKIFLSDSKENNFRYKIDPTYKANRTAPKPKHLNYIKEYLIAKYKARIAIGMEADDALGITQIQIPDLDKGFKTVICSIDKDLLQIPGLHYNFVKKEFTIVTLDEGFLSFYRSILTGDVADNIKGVYGIGPVRAAKILHKWEGEEAAINYILNAYSVWFEKEGNTAGVAEMVRKNGQLLKIKQSEVEPLWDSEFLKRTTGQTLSSTPQPGEELNQSTEPITQEIRPLDGSFVAGRLTENILPVPINQD